MMTSSRLIVPGDEIKLTAAYLRDADKRWTVTHSEETDTEVLIRLEQEHTHRTMEMVLYKREIK